MVFILYISILLVVLFIPPGVFDMTATAVVYRDSSNTIAGILTFFQSNANTSVSVTGTLSGLNTTGAHVWLIKKLKICIDYFSF
jgi:Na+(H+)/acetate symporter ActP